MTTRTKIRWLAATITTLAFAPLWAQTDTAADHSQHQSTSPPAEAPTTQDTPKPQINHEGMNHGEMSPQSKPDDSMPGMNHAMPGDAQSDRNSSGAEQSGEKMEPGTGGSSTTPKTAESRSNSQHDSHGKPAAAAQEPKEMDMSEMKAQGGSPPVDARDPHAYSNGYESGASHPHMGNETNLGFLLADRFEAVRTSDATGAAYDLLGWYGRIYDRIVVKAEGEIADSELVDTSTELLWGHAIATFWDSQLGLRYDTSDGPDLGWLALGIQGLAPYWFELGATVYLGEGSRTALNLEAEYELLLTQKWVLQPSIEANFYGKNDIELGQSSGLSSLTAGLRLRYEIRREFAPYIGVEWASQFGDNADYIRAQGQDSSETRTVAGVRFWF